MVAVAVLLVIVAAVLLVQIGARRRRQVVSAALPPVQDIVDAYKHAVAGPSLGDSLPGNAGNSVCFDNESLPATMSAHLTSARGAHSKFLRVADSLCALIVCGNEAFASESRAVAIARIMAASQPLLYPGADADDVFMVWYWAMATVYLTNVPADGSTPAHEPLCLCPDLAAVLGADMDCE